MAAVWHLITICGALEAAEDVISIPAIKGIVAYLAINFELLRASSFGEK